MWVLAAWQRLWFTNIVLKAVQYGNQPMTYTLNLRLELRGQNVKPWPCQAAGTHSLLDNIEYRYTEPHNFFLSPYTEKEISIKHAQAQNSTTCRTHYQQAKDRLIHRSRPVPKSGWTHKKETRNATLVVKPSGYKLQNFFMAVTGYCTGYNGLGKIRITCSQSKVPLLQSYTRATPIIKAYKIYCAHT